jgi:CRP-like cAMP-binding protein
MIPVVQLLSTVELLHGLNADQLERLAAISQRESYTTDQVIFKEGAQGDKLYVIDSGQVEIRFDDEAVPALYLGSGQIFGEMALLDQGPRSATVIAIDAQTELYSIEHAAFIKLCEADTAIGFILMRNLALDLSFKLRVRN